ncbi:MAG: nucleoside monophosphate kinase [Candidatus Omnitrophota bacterium]|nr:nucleoside monophosphate kinase [Candidatus Omnitrophota bacterium]
MSPSTLPTSQALNAKAPQGNPSNDVEAIYQQYLKAFKKGVYNYIKEEQDPITQQIIPRKYFSGGINATDFAQLVLQTVTTIDAKQLNTEDLMNVSADLAMSANAGLELVPNPVTDRAMAAHPKNIMDGKFFANFEGPVYYPASELDLKSIVPLAKLFPKLTKLVYVDFLDPDEMNLATYFKPWEDDGPNASSAYRYYGSKDLPLLQRQMKRKLAQFQYRKEAIIDQSKTSVKIVSAPSKELRLQIAFEKNIKSAPWMNGRVIEIKFLIRNIFDYKRIFDVIYVNYPGYSGTLADNERFWEAMHRRTSARGYLVETNAHSTTNEMEAVKERYFVRSAKTSFKELYLYSSSKITIWRPLPGAKGDNAQLSQDRAMTAKGVKKFVNKFPMDVGSLLREVIRDLDSKRAPGIVGLVDVGDEVNQVVRVGTIKDTPLYEKNGEGSRGRYESRKLKSVFRELLINAYDASPSHSNPIKVQISLSGKNINISIENKGRIDFTELRQRLFNAGERWSLYRDTKTGELAVSRPGPLKVSLEDHSTYGRIDFERIDWRSKEKINEIIDGFVSKFGIQGLLFIRGLSTKYRSIDDSFDEDEMVSGAGLGLWDARLNARSLFGGDVLFENSQAGSVRTLVNLHMADEAMAADAGHAPAPDPETDHAMIAQAQGNIDLTTLPIGGFNVLNIPAVSQAIERGRTDKKILAQLEKLRSSFVYDKYASKLREWGQQMELKGDVVYCPFGGFDPATPLTMVGGSTDIVSMGREGFGTWEDIKELFAQPINIVRAELTSLRYDSPSDWDQLKDQTGISGMGPLAIARIMAFLHGKIRQISYFDLDQEGNINFLNEQHVSSITDGAKTNAVVEFEVADEKTGKPVLKRFWYIQRDVYSGQVLAPYIEGFSVDNWKDLKTALQQEKLIDQNSVILEKMLTLGDQVPQGLSKILPAQDARALVRFLKERRESFDAYKKFISRLSFQTLFIKGAYDMWDVPARTETRQEELEQKILVRSVTLTSAKNNKARVVSDRKLGGWDSPASHDIWNIPPHEYALVVRDEAFGYSQVYDSIYYGEAERLRGENDFAMATTPRQDRAMGADTNQNPAPDHETDQVIAAGAKIIDGREFFAAAEPKKKEEILGRLVELNRLIAPYDEKDQELVDTDRQQFQHQLNSKGHRFMFAIDSSGQILGFAEAERIPKKPRKAMLVAIAVDRQYQNKPNLRMGTWLMKHIIAGLHKEGVQQMTWTAFTEDAIKFYMKTFRPYFNKYHNEVYFGNFWIDISKLYKLRPDFDLSRGHTEKRDNAQLAEKHGQGDQAMAPDAGLASAPKPETDRAMAVGAPVVLLMGIPASGKGMVGLTLFNKLGIPHISLGELLSGLEKDQRQGSKRLLEVLKANPSLYAKGFILDLSPISLERHKGLEKVLEEEGFYIKGVINVNIENETARKRFIDRGYRPGEGKEKDLGERFDERLVEREDVRTSLVQSYRERKDIRVFDLDNSGTPNDLETKINGMVEEFKKFLKDSDIDNAQLGDDKATVSNTGGIDLTPANLYLQTSNSGGQIKFHIDPAILQQLQNASGFVPVIINIQPLNNLPEFLGIVN